MSILSLLLTLHLTQPVRVAVVDTGLNLSDKRYSSILCATGHKDFTNTGIEDSNGHGTSVVGLIKKYAKHSNFCLIIVKYYLKGDVKNNDARSVAAMRYASSLGVKYINYSSNGEDPIEEEYLTIVSHPKIKYVVAAGNEGLNLDVETNKSYPTSYFLSNIVSVGSLDKKGEVSRGSNYGKNISTWEMGDVQEVDGIINVSMSSGTSLAAAIHTGKLINETSSIRSIH